MVMRTDIQPMVLTPAQIDTMLGYSRAAGARWRKRVGLVRLPWSDEQHPRYLREDVERAIRGEPSTGAIRGETIQAAE